MGEHNDGRGKLGYSKSTKPAKLRRCNNCGHEVVCYSDTHKVWSKEKKANVYCGYMRVVRE